ncbi:hypothetical protein BC751_2769 [Cecembia calidifontis]|uniref:Uncharacterized protein n=1 Tax=Cecembia calidifontis TaxID=1187080 RepID=A0A4Q7PAE5_9BACT|nr:hypothetical protein BC751_2769 [Cecembia calidifontis]
MLSVKSSGFRVSGRGTPRNHAKTDKKQICMGIENSTFATALFIDQPERKIMEKKSFRMDLRPARNHGVVPREGTTKKLDLTLDTV